MKKVKNDENSENERSSSTINVVMDFVLVGLSLKRFFVSKGRGNSFYILIQILFMR